MPKFLLIFSNFRLSCFFLMKNTEGKSNRYIMNNLKFLTLKLQRAYKVLKKLTEISNCIGIIKKIYNFFNTALYLVTILKNQHLKRQKPLQISLNRRFFLDYLTIIIKLKRYFAKINRDLKNAIIDVQTAKIS